MTAEMKLESGLPELVEAYRDFEPPRNFKQVIETLLAYVPPKYLVGLKTIILTNSSALSRDRRRQKTWSRNHKVRLSECGGSYSRATKSSPAIIWLYVDNIVRGLPRWMTRPPMLRYMVPSDVLYHEIGHHIHAVHKPIHEQREDVAEEWTHKLWSHFLRKHYWYLLPVLYPAALLFRFAKGTKRFLRRSLAKMPR
jgi:hypothetical protein